MTWRAALDKFWNSYLPSYPQTSVPEKIAFPWNAYEVNKGSFGTETSSTAHLHYYSESEKIPNEMADKIVKDLDAGKIISCDEGKMVLYSGNPAWISPEDETDNKHKHRIINFDIMWLTTR